MLLLAVLIELITVHMVDGRTIEINPRQITQLVHPHGSGHRTLIGTVKCVIRLTDGSFVSVAETCEEIQAKINGR